MRSANDYLKMLQSLLPTGRLWTRRIGSVLTQVLTAVSKEFARLEERVHKLWADRDSRTTTNLLEEHERDLGLPDSCTELAGTIQERRQDVHAKTIARGRQDKPYFIDIAKTYGWDIDIIEYRPFWSGIGVSGEPAGDQDVLFYWTLVFNYSFGGSGNIIYFESGSSQSGDLISYIQGIEAAFCRIEKYKPAHSVLNYTYEGPGFNNGFSNGFDSIPSDDPSYLEGGFNKGFSNGFDRHNGGGFSKGFSDGFDKQS